MLFALLPLILCEESAAKSLKRDVIGHTSYCYKDDITTQRPSECPMDAFFLENQNEIRTVLNQPNVDVTIFFYGLNNKIVLSPNDLKAKSIFFVGQKTTWQEIDFTLNNEGIATFTSTISFESIQIVGVLPSTSTATKVNLTFNNVTMQKSYVEGSQMPADGAKKALKASVDVVVEAEIMFIDLNTYNPFILSQKHSIKMDKLTVFIGIAKADFTGFGQSVTLSNGLDSSVVLDKDELFGPLYIGSVERESDIDLKVTAESGASNPLPLAIVLKKGTKLNAHFEGDWSNSEVVVSGEDLSTFTGAKKTAADKSPKMFYAGSGTATLDGQKVPTYTGGSCGTKNDNDNNNSGEKPGSNNNISDGAIAGIVIVVIVVVVAVVVVSIIVIKKKKNAVTQNNKSSD